MTYLDAVKALKSEGASSTDPLYYAYCDGYYNAKTMITPTAPELYIGVSTINGYFKNAEIVARYTKGLEAGSNVKKGNKQ